MHCAIAGLRTHGYRLPTSRPGHHQTAIQSLALTLDISTAQVAVYDAPRRKRNGIDYEADVVSEAMAKACIEAAAEILAALGARRGNG